MPLPLRKSTLLSAAEADANSIAARFADYFAIPTHTSMFSKTGGAEAKIETNGNSGGDLLGSTGNGKGSFGQLSGTNHASVSGSIANIVIKVRDASDRCPTDYQAANDEWNGSNLYTKEMK